MPARYLLPVAPPYVRVAPPTETLWQFALLSDALLTPYTGLMRAGVSPGTVCVVLGQGTRAQLAAVMAEALGLFVVRFSAQEAAQLDPAAARQHVAELAKAQGLPLAGACIVETGGANVEGSLVAEPEAGAQLVSVAVLQQVVAMQAQVLAVAPHPDLLPELLALCGRAQLDLASHTRAVRADEIEAVMAARRSGQETDLRLPIVQFA